MARISNQDDYQKTALRVPRDLHTKIIESAKRNNRTMNAEIVERLEASFDRGQGVDSFEGLREENVKMINLMIEHLKIAEKGI